MFFLNIIVLNRVTICRLGDGRGLQCIIRHTPCPEEQQGGVPLVSRYPGIRVRQTPACFLFISFHVCYSKAERKLSCCPSSCLLAVHAQYSQCYNIHEESVSVCFPAGLNSIYIWACILLYAAWNCFVKFFLVWITVWLAEFMTRRSSTMRMAKMRIACARLSRKDQGQRRGVLWIDYGPRLRFDCKRVALSKFHDVVRQTRHYSQKEYRRCYGYSSVWL